MFGDASNDWCTSCIITFLQLLRVHIFLPQHIIYVGLQYKGMPIIYIGVGVTALPEEMLFFLHDIVVACQSVPFKVQLLS